MCRATDKITLHASILEAVQARRFVVVIDQVVGQLYEPLYTKLCEAPNCLGGLSLIALEKHKSITELESVIEGILALETNRDDVLVAIGGGITTDIAGLAAHLMKRGMPWIAVPTTLVGMIDAAIGGKTGIDSPQGKNLIGAYHLPEKIIIEKMFLETLPEREWINGLGEAVKYGYLEAGDFIDQLFEGQDYKALTVRYMDTFIKIKQSIVRHDLQESGQRMTLNLGHTLGHCLERHHNYEKYAHGESVLYGLVWSLILSYQHVGLSPVDVNRYLEWLSKQSWYDPEVLKHPEWFLSGLRQDKKMRRGSLNFILLKRPGQALIQKLALESLERLLLKDGPLRDYGVVPKSAILFPSPLGGELLVPPSKSDAHRAIIAGALAALSGESDGEVTGLVYSEDVEATLRGMEAFGLRYDRTEAILRFYPSQWQTPSQPINCSESGSTLRFLIPLSQVVEGPVTFTGENHLRQRPLDDYINLFNAAGIRYQYDQTLPIEIWQGTLPHTIYLQGNISSQFFSGLFFTLPLLKVASKVKVIGTLESKGYVDMTLSTLSRHGIEIVNANCDYQTFEISPYQNYHAIRYTVEGDYSNAAFWIVAGQLGRPVRLKGLKITTDQRDQGVISLIQAMGGRLYWDGEDLMSLPSSTHGIQIDAREIPDLVPIMAVLAALSEGTTEIVNAQRLRLKESDRILSTVSELKKIGADIIQTESGMRIRGVSHLSGGIVDSWKDHRIAMALAVASSRCLAPVIITGAEAVKKSYPNFFDDFQALGGRIQEVN